VARGLSILRLSDDGPGVPERALANLFQPFVGSVRRGGTGLGLAIARELAQGHGGDLVLVETGPGGSVFDLSLAGFPLRNPCRNLMTAPTRRRPEHGRTVHDHDLDHRGEDWRFGRRRADPRDSRVEADPTPDALRQAAGSSAMQEAADADLLVDGQEEVFSRAEVEAGLVEHQART
jgi:hypothetical protein